MLSGCLLHLLLIASATAAWTKYTKVVALPYDASCVKTADCAFKYANCVSGSCKCDRNHKHDPSTGACVRQCDEYGEEFTFYDTMAIAGLNDRTLKTSGGIDECIKLCLAESITTLSIDFKESEGVCYCSTIAPGMNGVAVYTYKDWGLAVRQCGSPVVPLPYGTPCVTTSDCPFDYSECVSGSCKCDRDHKHDPSTGTCVSQCDQYGEEFTFYDTVAIKDRNDRTLKAKGGINECIKLCLAESITTLSIDFKKSGGVCKCSTAAPGMDGVVVKTYKGYGLAVRQCGSPVAPVTYGAPCVKTADCVFKYANCVSGSCKCDTYYNKYDPSTDACYR